MNQVKVSIICDEISQTEVIEHYSRQQAIKITPRTLVQKKNSYFNCCICLEVVDQATKCSECETAFCKKCASKTDSCPHCRCTPFVLKPLNRYEQARLNGLKFDCPRCEDQVAYAEAASHV